MTLASLRRRSEPGTPVRTFIVNGTPVAAHGLRLVLEADGRVVVVGEASRASEALHAILSTKPDLAIVDAVLPGGGSGLDLCRQIRAVDPKIRVLLFGLPRTGSAYDAVLAGASGVVRDTISPAALVHALKVVASGHTLLDSTLTAEALTPPKPEPGGELADLTPREREVLDFLVQGLTNKQIAHKLHLSPHTIKNHVTSVMAKLGVERRGQAALLATRRKDAGEAPDLAGTH